MRGGVREENRGCRYRTHILCSSIHVSVWSSTHIHSIHVSLWSTHTHTHTHIHTYRQIHCILVCTCGMGWVHYAYWKEYVFKLSSDGTNLESQQSGGRAGYLSSRQAGSIPWVARVFRVTLSQNVPPLKMRTYFLILNPVHCYLWIETWSSFCSFMCANSKNVGTLYLIISLLPAILKFQVPQLVLLTKYWN